MPQFIDGEQFVQMNAPYTHLNIDFALMEVNQCVVDILIDTSTSVHSFERNLVDALNKIFEYCKESKFSRNLMVRLTAFNTVQGVMEIFGYVPIMQLDETLIPKSLQCISGKKIHYTNLHYATQETLKAGVAMCWSLEKNDKAPAYLLCIITDGCDTERSGQWELDPSEIATTINIARTSEKLESLTTRVFGINVNDTEVKQALESFKKEANLDRLHLDFNSKEWKEFVQTVSTSIAAASSGVPVANSGPRLSV